MSRSASSEEPTSSSSATSGGGARSATLEQPSQSEEQGQDTDQGGEGGEEPQGDEEPQGPGGHTPSSFLATEQVGWLTKDINKAVRSGDSKTAARLMDEQFAKVMEGLHTQEFLSQAQHPLLASPNMEKSRPEVAMAAVASQVARREMMIGDVLQRHDWGSIQSYGDSIVERYKTRNKAPLINETAGMTPQQLQDMTYQFEPVRVDPNEVAQFRQRLVKLDQEMRPLGTSVWTDTRTARIAKILNVEAGPGTPGYLKSEEQSITGQMSLPERALLQVRFGAEEAAQETIDIAEGVASTLETLGSRSLDALTGGNGAAHYNPPTNWVQDAEGKWWNNGGKVGVSEITSAIWYQMTGHLIQKEMQDYGDAKSAAIMRESGIESLATGVGHVIGSFAPYMATGGVATKWITKGLGWLATGGKAVESLGRAAKITQWLAEGAGAAAGMGAYEGVKNGKIEGYGVAFAEGAKMGLLMMMMGAMGRSTERLLNRTIGIPAKLAQVLSGAAEGVGFAHLDPHTWELGWQFLKNPNADTFAPYAKVMAINSIAMAAIKGATGTTPGGMAGEGLRDLRQQQELSKTAAGAAAPEEVAASATEAGVSTETLGAHGEALRQREVTAGKLPEQALEAHQRAQETGERLNLERTGLASTEGEKQDVRFSTVEELRRIKEMPAGHEKNQAIIDALNRSRGALGKSFAKFAEDVVPKVIEGKELGKAKEITEAGKVVSKMLGVQYRPREAPKVEEKLPEWVRQSMVESGKNPSRMFNEVDASRPGFAEMVAKDPVVQKMPTDLRERAQRGDLSVAEYQAEVKRQKESHDFIQHIQREPTEGTVAEARAPSPPAEGTPASQRMQPSLEQEGVPGTAKIRASDVLRDMQGYEGDPVRVPIRQGVGVRGHSTKGILGWFHTHENIVRMEGARDIVTGAHEWSHAMDRAAGFYSEGAREVAGLKAAAATYPGLEKLPEKQQRSEGWAEFWARHMLDDPDLKKDTGAFHDEAMKWLAQPQQAEIRAQVERVQSSLRQYRDQGAVKRGEAAIHFYDDEKSIQELKSVGVMKDTLPHKAAGFFRKLTTAFRKAVTDDLVGLKNAQFEALKRELGSKEAAQKALEETPITANPARLMDVLRMTASKQAERFLLHSTHNLKGERTGISGQEALGSFDSRQQRVDFENYLRAKRELEDIEKGKETTISKQDNLTTVAKLETKDFVDRAEALKQYDNRVIDYGTEGGLWSNEQADAIKNAYKVYVPFMRFLEGPKVIAPGRGVAERGTGVRSSHGSQLEIVDPLTSIADMTRNVITKAQQNMVMKAMVKFGLHHEGVGSFVTEVKRGLLPKDHPLQEIVKALQAGAQSDQASMALDKVGELLESMEKAGEIGAMVTLFGQQTIPKGSKPLIAHTLHLTEEEINELPTERAQKMAREKNGKLLWLETDLEAYDALMGIASPQSFVDLMPAFARAIVEKPAKWLRAGATVAAPAFAARNQVRDVIQNAVYSGGDGNPVAAVGRAIKGAMQVIGGSEESQLWDALGGSASTFHSTEIAAGRAAPILSGESRGVMTNLKFAYGKMVDAIGTPESFLRVQEMKMARDKALAEGKPTLEANLLGLEAGRESGINYARMGSLVRGLNRITPYTGASVNATGKFLRQLSGADGGNVALKTMLRGFTSITVPTLALWWLNKDKEWYQQLPEWERLNYWHIDLPFGIGRLKISKPFELGRLFGNLPEHVFDLMHGSNPMSTGKVMGDFFQSLLPNSMMPAFMAPIVAAWANKDPFTGRSIVPDWMERSRLPHDQVTAYTRWYGKMLSDAFLLTGLDVSPMHIEHFTNQMTGGMIGRVSDFTESMAELGGFVKSHEHLHATDIPVVGTMFGRGDFTQSRDVQKIFDLSSEFEQKAGSKQLTIDDRRQQHQVDMAKKRISLIMGQARDGKISRDDANKQAYDVAHDALERFKP
jgi:hypothetical protein